LPRYVKWCEPDIIYIENVPEFVRWGKLSKKGKRIKSQEGGEYRKWIESIKDLGYTSYDKRFLNAADFGCPTKRIRYFGVFVKPGFEITWPAATHAEKANGLPGWIACKDYINLLDEGASIFGRKKPLVNNTLRRIAGGISKFAPEMYFIMKYYGNSVEGNNYNCQSVNDPLHTLRTKESHCLITLEKLQFIQDYCFVNRYDHPNKPMSTLMKWETKQLVTIKNQFISAQYNSNGKPEANNQSVCAPLGSCTTKEKFQFITTYFNAGGRPESQNESLDRPIGSILTMPNKKALVTADLHTLIDFDVKMRFITDDEAAAIMGFPSGYFKRPGLKLSKKQIFKMVGNSVPPGMAKAVIEPYIPQFVYLNKVAV
jgi:DNA (cytosine-5)-methyltransferase 1